MYDDESALLMALQPSLVDEFGWTQLHDAVLNGWGQARDALIEAGANVKIKSKKLAMGSSKNIINSKGWFYIRQDMVRPRLRPGHAFDKGTTPLHLAAATGDLRSVKVLLGARCRPVRDGVGATPLHLAAHHGHEDVVALLLTLKMDVQAATKVAKSGRFHDVGMTALHCALESGSFSCVKRLVAAGAESTVTKAGCSVHFFGARGGDVASLDLLAAPVASSGGHYSWPLLEACRRGHTEVVRWLLSRGATPEDDQGHSTALRAAVEHQHAQTRAVMLAHGAKPLPMDNPAWCARTNDTWSLRELHARGMDLSVSHRGSTPLMSAAAKGHEASAALLLELGADPNVVTSYTALHVAISNEAWGVFDLLLVAGADCSLTDSYGNDVLRKLIYKRDATMERVVRVLELGGSPHRRNRNGSRIADCMDGIDAVYIPLLRAVSPPADADAAAFVGAQADVLRAADASAPWKSLSNVLWDALVPPSGEAASVQGELIRCIGNLTDEAYRNGNLNFGDRHRAMVDFLADHLASPELLEDLRAIRLARPLNVSDDSPHYRVSEAAVRWCLAHRDLVLREG